jgi:uncharacterized protein with PIN domain
MLSILFQFYGELNDFLPRHRRNTEFGETFKDKRSIKDAIESLGVPHTEIDIIIANGKSTDFEYILQDGDCFSIYPLFDRIAFPEILHLRRFPPYKKRFVADIHLGNIVKYMRALGIDVCFNMNDSPRDIIGKSNQEKRIILTKSIKLLKHKEVAYGYYVRPGPVETIIRKIIDVMKLEDDVLPFSRCLCCNGVLVAIEKGKISERIPPRTRGIFDDYVYCETCDKIYWAGSHVIKMKKVLARIWDQDRLLNDTAS